jgi:hypothetical protein
MYIYLLNACETFFLQFSSISCQNAVSVVVLECKELLMRLSLLIPVLQVNDASTVIPRNSVIEANQSGLIAEPLIDITPQVTGLMMQDSGVWREVWAVATAMSRLSGLCFCYTN